MLYYYRFLHAQETETFSLIFAPRLKARGMESIMKDIHTYCNYLYNYLTVPLYLLEEGCITACWPEQKKAFYPPRHYIDKLEHFQGEISICFNAQQACFGLIVISESGQSLLVGPVGFLPYNNHMIKYLCNEYSILSEDIEDFTSFFRNIPVINYGTFLKLLLLLNLNLNGHSLQQEDIAGNIDNYSSTAVKERHSAETYQLKESEKIFDNFDVEQEFLYYIEKGDLKKLKEFSLKIKHVDVGTIANDNLRQMKNMCLVTLTLVSRAAMRGGLPSGIAYTLSNAYYQHIEKLNNISLLNELVWNIQEDYCIRVAENNISEINDDMLLKAIRYVQNNTNKNIKVFDIARHVGYSSEYLSRRFKKELGFGLNEFIRRCKLEESKMLLSYTNMSISEISSYLYFSSQSHFQKVFREQYQITPFAYRRSHNMGFKAPMP